MFDRLPSAKVRSDHLISLLLMQEIFQSAEEQKTCRAHEEIIFRTWIERPGCFIKKTALLKVGEDSRGTEKNLTFID